MEELSIKQKAQAYDEAVEKIKYVMEHGVSPVLNKEDLQDIFPQLKESEDEKIRNFISNELACLRATNEKGSDRYEEFTNAITWLEKQGEQKPTEEYNIRSIGSKHAEGKLGEMIKNLNPADKVEPKFHEGEWIIRSAEGFKHNTYLVKEVKDYYACEDLKDRRVTFTLNDVHKNFKLWDISDAKPGDVLVCKGNIEYSNGIKYKRICLFNNLDNAFFILTKISNCVEDYGIDVNIDYPDNTVPATKEQKEILFMAMKDAGYTFDFEKKELNKL